MEEWVVTIDRSQEGIQWRKGNAVYAGYIYDETIGDPQAGIVIPNRAASGTIFLTQHW